VSPDKGKRAKSKGRRSPEQTPTPAADESGPPYVVRWHPAAVDERDASSPAREQVALLHAAQKLEAVGPRLGHPHSSAVRGEAGKGFRELRPRAGRSRWRALYRQVGPSTFVILAVGPEAQIDQRRFDDAVDRAVARFADLDVDS
jgi:hypothetical protein